VANAISAGSAPDDLTVVVDVQGLAPIAAKGADVSEMVADVGRGGDANHEQ